MNTVIHQSQRTNAPRHNLQEWEHDPYHSKKKLTEPTVCPDCGAVYHAGRWQWSEAAKAAQPTRCPACQRIQEQCPAGFLTLSGAFLAAHQDEIRQRLYKVVECAKAEHPLQRLMALQEAVDGSLQATFTAPNLARAVGEALQDAYQGDLDFDYQPGEYLLRVRWHR
jgi:NMD protein affecting ribosome stability and mRNA decay